MPKESRILILEPVPVDAEVIELQIRKAGVPFTSRRVANKEAFDLIIGDFAPDLIIAERATPRCNVLDMVRAGMRDHPEIRWIILSNAGTEDMAVECIKAGAAGLYREKGDHAPCARDCGDPGSGRGVGRRSGRGAGAGA